ncbi:spermine synthase [Anabaena azotica]|uniref:spermine/spermidine synthase domain-containing protein n=1 Tax=Anabaena azotica TaxID=197653 RepID=UPI0039A59C3B
MNNSLFIEQHDDGIAFYINGDLQFDTTDEAIYHEYLVIPAISLAIQRFPHTDLRVLICGGGDGLAARDVLRFEQVKKIDLVDYNPEVLELANTVFKPYNLGSLEQEKVTVYTQEAFEFVSKLNADYYHVVICDFTYPNSSEETTIYSQEWFKKINLVISHSGIIATNAVSPYKNNHAFWCLYQTLLSADLLVKPLQIDIPSFRDHGYGNWGFFLGSSSVVLREEIENIYLPNNLNAINHQQLLSAFIFDEGIAGSRDQVTIHSLENEKLFYYLLNYSDKQKQISLNSGEYLDFLDINEQVNAQIGDDNSLNLESVAKFWLENIYAAPNAEKTLPDIHQYLPVRHRYHNSKMTTAWLSHLQELLSEIDVKQLLNSLLSRAQELPPHIANELKNLADKISSNQPLGKLNPKMAEFIALLSVTLLMANLVAPDSVFAKGSYSGSSNSSGDSTDDLKGFGFVLTYLGGYWLYSIIKRLRNGN